VTKREQRQQAILAACEHLFAINGDPLRTSLEGWLMLKLPGMGRAAARRAVANLDPKIIERYREWSRAQNERILAEDNERWAKEAQAK
jgi:hypothetical protein